MSGQFEEIVFSYREVLPARSLAGIPDTLKLDRPSHEAVLFRLLLGTLDVTHKLDNRSFKQRTNYAHLGTKGVTALSKNRVYDCQVAINIDEEKFNKYMIRNRSNLHVFQAVLSEFTNYFYQKSKGAHMSAFAHLYRCLEHISYSFPLVYAAKSGNYLGTYNDLKSFLTNSDTGELGFFRKFQDKILDDTSLSFTFDVDLSLIDPPIKENIIEVINKQSEGLRFVWNGNQVKIPARHLLSFCIRLRNRFFHYLSGSGQQNISTVGIHSDCLFEHFNEPFANWIAFIYFEICRFGFENL